MEQKPSDNTVTDREGNVYGTLKIGNQTWMAENLRSSQFNNGEDIPTTDPLNLDLRPTNHDSLINPRDFDNAPDPIQSQGSAEPSPIFQWIYPGNTDQLQNYGRLYTWHAANDPRGICPAGWRIPTQGDWNILFNFLGGKGKAGSVLKASGARHWKTPNSGATNSSGFTAMPAGKREKDGTFAHQGSFCAWWTSNSGVYFHLEYDDPYVYRNYYYKSKYYGFSVRCLKSNETD